MPPEIAHDLGVGEGSLALLRAENGRLEVEVLPPPASDLARLVREECEASREALEEMRRLGD